MKRFLMMFAMLGIVLTGCEKGGSSEDAEPSVEGKWVVVSEEDTDSGNSAFVIGRDIVPAVVIEGNSYFKAKVPVSADCILKQNEAHELFVGDDGKWFCSEGPSPQGEVTSSLELREDKLFITKTYEVNETVTKQILVRSDLPVKAW